jgi:polysaccharide biosynthesis/export protein
MLRKRNHFVALSPIKFELRNTLRRFGRKSEFACHFIYPIDIINHMKRQLVSCFRPIIIFCMLILFSISGTLTPTLADNGVYRLRAGDAIEISIAGVSEVKQRFVLDLDGQISVPLVGVIKAEGSTIGELRDKLQHILPRDIAVNMVDYSPVYINGDVVKPGELRFRPNMTVRQAVALAGGYEVMRYHLVDPVIQSADLGADYQTLWTEQAREQARLERLKAELNNEAQLGAGPAESPPVSNQLQSDIVNNEAQQLALWHSDFDKEMASLNRAIKSATDQLAELVEQRDKEKEGAAADSEELQRLSAFNKQGDVTSNRVVEARRAMLFSSTRVLQTEEQIVQTTREREGYIRRIDKFRDDGRSVILKEIEDSQVKIAGINARIAAAADKMVYTSTMRSQLPISKLGGPSVTIIRGDRENRSKTEASEDSVLEPGDVIEISVIPKTKVTDKQG